MFVFNEKMVTTQSNYISIGMGDYYMYIQKNVYDKLNELYYKYKTVEDFLESIPELTQEQKENCIVHLDKLKYPEAILSIYGVLFSEGLKDVDFESYIGSISMLMSDTLVIRNKLEDLIRGDIQYSINVFNDYKFARKEFETTCIKYEDLVSPKDIRESQFVFLKAYEHDARFGSLQMAPQQYVQPNQTNQTNTELIDIHNWRSLINDPQARYAGYGEFYHDTEGLIVFENYRDIEDIEKYLGWDTGETKTELEVEKDQVSEDVSFKPKEEETKYEEPKVETVKHLVDLLAMEGIDV